MLIQTYINQHYMICRYCNEDNRRRIFHSIPFLLFHRNSSLNRQRSNFLIICWCYLLHFASYLRRGLWNCGIEVSCMGTKMKGIYKGFKCTLSQIFVVKEREIEIGHPTDVKHLAHIGWDGPSGAAPTWMNEFRTGPNFASTSIGHSGSALSPWSSLDFGESTHQRSGSEMFTPSTEVPSSTKKKQKRKKTKSTSSPKSLCSSRSSKVSKSKPKFVETNAKPTNIEVA